MVSGSILEHPCLREHQTSIAKISIPHRKALALDVNFSLPITTQVCNTVYRHHFLCYLTYCNRTVACSRVLSNIVLSFVQCAGRLPQSHHHHSFGTTETCDEIECQPATTFTESDKDCVLDEYEFKFHHHQFLSFRSKQTIRSSGNGTCLGTKKLSWEIFRFFVYVHWSSKIQLQI